MKIIITTDNIAGMQSQLFVALNKLGCIIEKQALSQTQDAKNLIYEFFVSGASKSPEELISTLKQNPKVFEVSVEGFLNQDLKAQQQKLTELTYKIADNYPHFVPLIINLEEKLPSNDRYQLGQKVGKTLVKSNKIKAFSTNSIDFALKKMIIPAIKPFALVSSEGNVLTLQANPFILNRQKQSEPSCYFLAGFIYGLLETIPQITNLTAVIETTCKITGAPSCTFKVG